MDPSNRERMEKRIRDQLNRHQYSSTKPKTQSLESPEFEDLIDNIGFLIRTASPSIKADDVTILLASHNTYPQKDYKMAIVVEGNDGLQILMEVDAPSGIAYGNPRMLHRLQDKVSDAVKAILAKAPRLDLS